MKSKEPDCISNNIKKYRLLNNMTQEARVFDTLSLTVF